MKKKCGLGNNGLTIPAIGLGCMGMSEFYGPKNDEQSLNTMAIALEHGINFFDTADVYGSGHNEELLGKFLKGRRDKIVLATKFGIVRQSGAYERTINNSSAYIEQACEASLRRLGVDVIDLYYCHRRNQETPIEEMIEALAKLVKSGKIKEIGLSEVSPETLRAAHAVHPIAAVQSEYSLWSREPEKEMLSLCKQLGTTFVAYSPLGRGFLTGKIVTSETLSETDFRRHNPRFQDQALAQNKKVLDQLTAFSARKGFTPAQIALAWLMRKNDNVVPIPGTRRVERLLENITAIDIHLDAQEITELDTIFVPERIIGARYAENGMIGLETSV